jgi:hypothetical protein
VFHFAFDVLDVYVAKGEEVEKTDACHRANLPHELRKMAGA